MRREWCALMVVVVLLAGCSSGTTGDSVPESSSTSPTTATVVATSSASAAPSTVAELPSGAGAVVEVSGGALPAAVTGAVTSRGGELGDTASWDARYETYGLPRVAGSGVRLVAGEIEATAVEDGWQRRDALQWLLMDVSHASLGEILEELAVAAGLERWQVSERAEMVGNGDCLERRFTTSSTSTTWELSGCSYPDMAGMFAVAVERSGVFANAPSLVDPSVAAVASAMSGQLTSVSVFFGPPLTAGSASTLTVSATVGFEAGLEEAQVTLTAGPLAGWRASPGEGSVMYAGGVGSRWVLSSGSAVFAAAGRLSS